ncbi:hypothetical protein HMPREF1870_02638 [Bacteroidales bacterium KA00344]|nr:hypothetical protein HMPREF1870_02638 [Bacteroidales bacterium KA00344]
MYIYGFFVVLAPYLDNIASIHNIFFVLWYCSENKYYFCDDLNKTNL